MTRLPRVLLIAEAANPEFVSVPLIGWSLSNALRKIVDVHIVTQVRNRDALVRAGLIEGVDFTAIDSERLARPLGRLAETLRMGKGKGWTTAHVINGLAYGYFEALLWKRFGKEILSGAFDVVHRVTPLTPTLPSSVGRRCRRAGVPFVIGPLNGGVPWPRGFNSERLREREWLSYVRGIYKLLPGVRRTMAAASAIMVGSRHTQSEVPMGLQARCIYLPENGIDPDRFNQLASPGSHRGPLRVCYVGRMVPYKGADMLLSAAMPMLLEGSIELEMVGDGPMAAELRATAEPVRNRVTFHGWLEHERVQAVLASCDLLGFPSVREFGGGVVLEAMAIGVPPLVVDYGGPGELVSSERGFTVPIGSRDEIVCALRQQLALLVEDRSKLSEIGESGRSWVDENLTWARKAEQVTAVYSWVLGQTDTCPSFFSPDGSFESRPC